MRENKCVLVGSKLVSSLDELESYARELVVELLQEDPFCLWLEGPYGAGKTTTTQAILSQLGLEKSQLSHSPSYPLALTYHDLEISLKDVAPSKAFSYAHLDLYRLEKGAFGLADFGLDLDTWRGLFIEWPERLDPIDPSFAPTHKLQIEHVDKTRRHFQLLAYR